MSNLVSSFREIFHLPTTKALDTLVGSKLGKAGSRRKGISACWSGSRLVGMSTVIKLKLPMNKQVM